MNIELLSPEEWNSDPRSKIFRSEIHYVEKFNNLNFRNPVDIEMLRKYPFVQLKVIADMWGWKIRKKAAVEDLVEKKLLWDNISAGFKFCSSAEYEKYLLSLPAPELKKMLGKAGLNGKYTRKKANASMLIQWHSNTEAFLWRKVAEVAWILPAIRALKEGMPVNLPSARLYSLRDIAVKQYQYEEVGDRLAVGKGERWVVDGKKLTHSEVKSGLEGARETLLKFNDSTSGLVDELNHLRAANCGATKKLDWAKLEELRKINGRIAGLRGLTSCARAVECDGDRISSEMAALDKEATDLTVETDGMIVGLSKDQADRLIFLEKIAPQRETLRTSIAKQVRLMEEAINRPPDVVIEKKVKTRELQLF